ncbi:hypothetical protein ABC304_05885 [Microbacterium sp. 1P10UB]|uniref:DUF3885 domain-containing protein n=1 Tax=unclassified Microbacterium TaxID=2609290 RepID=UPI0039A2FE3C
MRIRTDLGDGQGRVGMLRRHRAVIAELFGEHTWVTVIAEDWPTGDGAAGWTAVHLPEAEPWRSVEAEDADGADGAAELFVAEVGATTLDDLLGLALDGRALFVLADPERRRLYAPYDLGADVFLVDEAERAAFRARHADWLSPRVDRP